MDVRWPTCVPERIEDPDAVLAVEVMTVFLGKHSVRVLRMEAEGLLMFVVGADRCDPLVSGIDLILSHMSHMALKPPGV